MRRLLPPLVSLAFAFATCFATGLVTWGRSNYSPSSAHRLQTIALLHGDLALSHDPKDLDHDFTWSEGGVHQVWGLGIPLARLPFYALARVWSARWFPDRLIFCFALGAVTLLAWHITTRPYAGDRGEAMLLDSAPFQSRLVFLIVLLGFPPFITLLISRFLVYEEVLAWVYLVGISIFLLLFAFWRQPRLGWLCALACICGVSPLFRPTLLFYAGPAMLLATFRLIELKRAPQAFFAWVGVFAGCSLLWYTNLRSFGGGFEFGHHLNVQRPDLMGSLYATRFDYPYSKEPLGSATMELVGALFGLKRMNGTDWYAPDLFVWQSRNVRWREMYLTTYDWSFLPLLIGGLLTCFPNRLRQPFSFWTGKPQFGALWAVSSIGLLFFFYLRTPPISSRYLVDFAPGFAILTFLGWRAILGKYGTVSVALIGIWLAWQISAARCFYGRPWNIGPPSSETGSSQTKSAVSLDHTSCYRSGNCADLLQIPYNGNGWEPETGEAMPAVLFIIKDPDLIELKLQSSSPTTNDSPPFLRAKLGLEELTLKWLRRENNHWIARFEPPHSRAFADGIQVLFLALAPPEHFSERTSGWKLSEIRWRDSWR